MLKINTSLIINAFAISACLILSNNVYAVTQESGIEVTGQGTILVEPNQFSLTLSIAEKGHFTDKIRAIVDSKSNQVIDVAKSLGVKANNINSARVYLRIIEEESKINVRGLEVNEPLATIKKVRFMWVQVHLPMLSMFCHSILN